MTYLAGVVLFIVAGYSIITLTKISEQNFIYDIALSWFIGAGYYSLTWFLLVYGFKVSVLSYISYAIIFTPLFILIFKYKGLVKENITKSFNRKNPVQYLPTGDSRVLIYTLLAYSIIVITIIIVHGISTPTNADDALRLRAYTPILAYDNTATKTANTLIYHNGPWPSFTTVLFWHIAGGVDHFYVNYTIATSFFFFITLIFIYPVLHGEPRRALYNVFLVLSLPLFIYHSTITYADARLAYLFALGFLFFAGYVRNSNSKDLKLTILFFTLTCLVKEKGEILGITGLVITALFVIYNRYIIKKKIEVNTVYFLAPLFFYLVVKNYNADNVFRYFTLISSAFDKLIQTVVLATPEQISTEGTRYSLRHGLFSSGNFGIIFYILIFNLIVNIKYVFHKKIIWEFLFLAIVSFEIYFFLEYQFDEPEILSVIVNRVAIILAVISSLFLSSLLSLVRSEAK